MMEEIKMKLIDRYVHEVGRYIPRRQRGDILEELRSLLVDTLEDNYGEDPSESDVEKLLKEFGRPRDVAASYYPQSQYLVGPTLYPLFRMVAWIVVAAVLGSQVLAWGIGTFVAGETYSILEMIGSLVSSVPSSLGWVLITFMILQYFDAKPYLDEESWDPKMLPEIKPEQEIGRGETIISLVFGILFLVLVSFFPQWIGFITSPGGKFYPNPVILDNLLLVQIALAVGVGFNLFLLWWNRRDMINRLFQIGVNIFNIYVLRLLVIGHNRWLAARGSGGLLDGLSAIEGLAEGGWELVGMHAFRLAFVSALIVTSVEIVVGIFRLVKNQLKSDFTTKDAILMIEGSGGNTKK
jgi:hypothetical protein